MKAAEKLLGNSYIIPCDIWLRDNPFSLFEPYSWYMVSNEQNENSLFRVNRKQVLVPASDKIDGNEMVGISYLTEKDSEIFKQRINDLCAKSENDTCYWEEALFNNSGLTVYANVIDHDAYREINTYEQLRNLESDSDQLQSDSINTISAVFSCMNQDITDIQVLKKGMTNRSFCFSCLGQKYIMRIPGEGTDLLINREKEAENYKLISGKGLCDDPVWIDPATGYKITKYLDNTRCADPENETDLSKCINKLKDFHDMDIQADHSFDLFEQIRFYETLRRGKPSAYRDYFNTKTNILSLKEYVDLHIEKKCLTHIDAIPDNFLFYSDEMGKEQLQLIDWEYAGMQDPHVDIAMFCIYSLYDKNQIDHVIDLYFQNNCPDEIRIKIWCYVAVCGFLWSNWCEYKRTLGVEFGEYSLRQYRYAKEFYRHAKKGIEQLCLR